MLCSHFGLESVILMDFISQGGCAGSQRDHRSIVPPSSKPFLDSVVIYRNHVSSRMVDCYTRISDAGCKEQNSFKLVSFFSETYWCTKQLADCTKKQTALKSSSCSAMEVSFCEGTPSFKPMDSLQNMFFQDCSDNVWSCDIFQENITEIHRRWGWTSF